MELKYTKAFPCAQAKTRKHDSIPPKIERAGKKDTSVSFKLCVSDIVLVCWGVFGIINLWWRSSTSGGVRDFHHDPFEKAAPED